MPDEDEKLRALRAAHDLLEPGGRLIFDVFAPSSEDIAETNGLWLEREPEHLRARRLGRGDPHAHASPCGRANRPRSMDLHWLSAIEWRRLIDEAGFDVAGLYGWFDRRPFKGDEDMIWVCRTAPPEDACTACSRA